MSSDDGTAIVAWSGLGSPNRVIAQKVSIGGDVCWGGGAIVDETSAEMDAFARVVPDGDSGAFVCWRSGGSTNVQRLDSGGAPVWSTPLAIPDLGSNVPAIGNGAAGGILVGSRPSSSLEIQHYDVDGNPLWASTVSLSGTDFEVVTGDTLGDIVVCSDGASMKAQKIDENGGILWGSGGLSISDLSGTQLFQDVATDGAGGVYVAFTHSQNLYVQHVRWNGTLTWGPSGLAICNGPESHEGAELAADGSGGALVTWFDDEGGTYDLYAQRAHPDFGVAWYPPKLVVSDAAGTQARHHTAFDGANGVVVAWADSRTGNGDVYAARIAEPIIHANISTFLRDSGGTLYSMPDTFALGCPQGDLLDAVVFVEIEEGDVTDPIPEEAITLGPLSGTDVAIYTSVSADSALVLSNGYYRTTLTIESYGGCGRDSAKVYLNGIPLGYAQFHFRSPDIVADPASGSYGSVEIIDVSVFSSHYPPGPYDQCVDFAAPPDTIDLTDLSVFSGHYGHADSLYGGSSVAYRGAIESEGSVQLSFEEDYPLEGPRKLHASVTLENVEKYQVMFVALRNDNPTFRFRRWHQDSDYPRSVPCVEVTRDGHNEIVLLVRGGKNVEGPLIRLGELELDVLSDQPLEITEDDFSLSVADLLALDGTARVFPAAEREVTPMRFQNQLLQNYPNPFNPSTTILFSLSAKSNVDLRVYDVQGRLVRTLVNDVRERNNHRVIWDGKNNAGNTVATGVYFYRLVAGDFVATKKMILLR